MQTPDVAVSGGKESKAEREARAESSKRSKEERHCRGEHTTPFTTRMKNLKPGRDHPQRKEKSVQLRQNDEHGLQGAEMQKYAVHPYETLKMPWSPLKRKREKDGERLPLNLLATEKTRTTFSANAIVGNTEYEKRPVSSKILTAKEKVQEKRKLEPENEARCTQRGWGARLKKRPVTIQSQY